MSNLGPGDKGKAVKNLQHVLCWVISNNEEFSMGPGFEYLQAELMDDFRKGDGTYGPQTEMAVRHVQNKAWLPETGRMDQATMGALDYAVRQVGGTIEEASLVEACEAF